MAYSSYGLTCYCKGLLNEAEIYFLKGLAFCEKTTLATWMSYLAIWLGEMYVNLGQFEKAQDYYSLAMSVFERMGSLPSWVNLCKLCVARAKALNNDISINSKEVTLYYDNHRFKIFGGWMARYIAETLSRIGPDHMHEAMKWINKAIEFDERHDTKWLLGNDYALYGELLKRKGEEAKAKENLITAIKIFKECGADGWVEKYEKELTALA